MVPGVLDDGPSAEKNGVRLRKVFAGMELVETAIAAYKTSLAADMRSHPDMRSDLSTKICCNPDNVVCRCEEI